MKKSPMDSDEEEVECAHCWVGEGEERCKASGHQNHSAFLISLGIIRQYYFLLHFLIFFSQYITGLPTPT